MTVSSLGTTAFTGSCLACILSTDLKPVCYYSDVANTDQQNPFA